MFFCDKRPLDRNEKVISSIFLAILTKNAATTKISPKLLENALTVFFSNFVHKFFRLSSLNPESFVAKLLTRFRNNRQYLSKAEVNSEP